MRFDSSDSLKFRRRRLMGRSVVSLYHAKEAEEFPGFFFSSVYNKSGKARRIVSYRVQTIKIYHHKSKLLVPFHGSGCKRMMTKDIRGFFVATQILRGWLRRTVLTMMAPMSCTSHLIRKVIFTYNVVCSVCFIEFL